MYFLLLKYGLWDMGSLHRKSQYGLWDMGLLFFLKLFFKYGLWDMGRKPISPITHILVVIFFQKLKTWLSIIVN